MPTIQPVGRRGARSEARSEARRLQTGPCEQLHRSRDGRRVHMAVDMRICRDDTNKTSVAELPRGCEGLVAISHLGVRVEGGECKGKALTSEQARVEGARGLRERWWR